MDLRVLGIILGVMGAVALIVKLDDIGLHMAKRQNGGAQALGRALVLGMPKLLATLSIIGTAAMLWVGGQIIVHGFHIHPAEWFGLHEGALAWFTDAALCGAFGLMVGGIIVAIHHWWVARKG